MNAKVLMSPSNGLIRRTICFIGHLLAGVSHCNAILKWPSKSAYLNIDTMLSEMFLMATLIDFLARVRPGFNPVKLASLILANVALVMIPVVLIFAYRASFICACKTFLLQSGFIAGRGGIVN